MAKVMHVNWWQIQTVQFRRYTCKGR